MRVNGGTAMRRTTTYNPTPAELGEAAARQENAARDELLERVDRLVTYVMGQSGAYTLTRYTALKAAILEAIDGG
jgi:hypothetical protein